MKMNKNIRTFVGGGDGESLAHQCIGVLQTKGPFDVTKNTTNDSLSFGWRCLMQTVVSAQRVPDAWSPQRLLDAIAGANPPYHAQVLTTRPPSRARNGECVGPLHIYVCMDMHAYVYGYVRMRL